MTSEEQLNFWDLMARVCLLTLTWNSAATKRAAKNINSPRWDELVFAGNQPMRLERRSEGADTRIAERFDSELSDRAVCHRNYNVGSSQCVFISTRVMDDKFSVAFEFFINVGHAFVEKAGVSEEFATIVWKQAESNIRGETSMDAFELRKLATAQSGDREKARNEYLNATFADAIAVYLLSLAVDVDYYDLRERDYPLLAPGALAERLRKTAELFPPNPGYEFLIHYRRR